MKKIPFKELKTRISLHKEWRKSNGEKGKRLVLIGADLKYTDLRCSDLSHADLSGANLTGSNLGGANLMGSDLSGANLTGANLKGADLRNTDFGHTDLGSAMLPKDMKNYTVKGLISFDEAVKNLDQIREQVLKNQEILEMDSWHSPCGTTHCLAGLAQINAGLKEDEVKAPIDGSRLIWPACHMFFETNETVIEFLEDREYAR